MYVLCITFTNAQYTSDYDVRTISGVNANQLNHHLEGRLRNMGQVIIDARTQYGVDRVFLARVFVFMKQVMEQADK